MASVRAVAAVLILAAALALPVSAHPAGSGGAVSFRTTDGITLRGWLWGNGGNVVIFSHMFGTNQSIWYDMARKAAAAGFTALTYDFRGVGSSSGRLVIARVDRDVLAAITLMRSRRPNTLFLVGASMGGTASLVAAGRTRVDGIIIMASGTRFQGLDARPYFSSLQMPKLFIVGRRDYPFYTSARVMYRSTPLPKELEIIPTGAHGTNMLRTEYRDEIERMMLGFLEKYSQR